MKKGLSILYFLLLAFTMQAQDQLVQVAKQYLLKGEFDKAAATYKQLLDYSPNDAELQQSYLLCLLGMKDYTNAEKLIKKQIKSDRSNQKLQYSLAKIYRAEGEEKKATKLFTTIIDDLKPLDEEIRYYADQFEKDNMLDYAIATYEKARTLQKENTYLYAEELAVLFDKKGDKDKALNNLLDLYISHPEKSEDIRATFQRIMDKPEKLASLQQKVRTRIAVDTNQMGFPDLMAWMFIQQNKYDSAFIQIKTIDNKLNERGLRVLDFARISLREKQFSAALSGYNFVIAKGVEEPFYAVARSEKLTCLNEQIQQLPNYTIADVTKIATEYADFLEAFPAFKLKETMREYAQFEAKYVHDIQKAIAILDEVVTANNVDKTFKGYCKLDMGDYQLINNDIWESSLLYSQVDKEFKQDMLGEEARFKNAKLSYYTGDFDWAQGQLDVLKASTSELIANDALNLSVLITENNPPADSNSAPLLMYARADLLEFQNKNDEALAVLDSITTEYPKHPLLDDILMARAFISIKKQEFNDAAMHLQKIVTSYGEDVLADDALYNLALINENRFNNKDEAKRLFEELILKYPGSTYINEARKNFRRLRGNKSDMDASTTF